MPCCGPAASSAPCALKHLEPAQQNTEQLPPASLRLAMACWHLALFLTGVLLAGEPSLGLAHLGVGWGMTLAPEGSYK